MNVVLGCDHGGYALKETILPFIKDMPGIEATDFGTFGPEPVDYPDIAAKVCAEIASGRFDRGILLCGTGIGISIAANKIKGIRAALCHDVYSARMAREHNDANVLAMGGRVVGCGLAVAIIEAWLGAEFAGGRHDRRVGKIAALEEIFSD